MVGKSLFEGYNSAPGFGPADLKVKEPSLGEMISPVVKGGNCCREVHNGSIVCNE